MRLSNKSTFSLACLILLFVFAAMPAMAQTIEATWAADRDDNGTADDPGWRVTLEGLAAEDTVTVTYLDPAGTAAAAAGTQGGFTTVATGQTSTTGQIEAAIGAVIAVQVVAGPSASPVTYQRVTFPAGGTGAMLPETDLVRLPKLKKLTTSNYYVNFADNRVTVTFDFADAVDGTNGAPGAPLHISDVGDPSAILSATGWQVVSVSGTDTVNLRSTLASNAGSTILTVALLPVYAQPADTEADGQAMVHYDNVAPGAIIRPEDTGATPPVPYPVSPVATPSDFQTPDIDANTIWDEDFYLSVTVIDDPDTSGATIANAAGTDGSGPDLKMANVSVDTTKLTVVRVGVNATQSPTAVDTADSNMDETDYLIHLSPNADRVTSAGEEVTITITPVDKKGNTGTPVEHTIKLAASNPAPTAVGTIAAQTLTIGDTAATVNVANNFNDTDALTYSAVSSATAVATVSVSGTVVSITPVAAGTATITVTASDTATPAQTVTQTIMVTVENPVPTAVGTIDAQNFIVGDAAATVNVASNFNDVDALTYSAESSVTAVATVSVTGSVVSITPVAAGTATITVTASDTATPAQTVTQTIMVTVNGAPTVVGTITAQTLTAGAAAATVDVASNFSDTDALTYTVVSSDDTKATATVAGSVVTITPVAEGTATITVTATDTGDLTATQSIMVTVNPVTFVSANPTSPSNIMMVEIPANSYVVLVRTMSTAGALQFPNVPPVGGDPVNTEVWSDMPDLHDLFLTSAQNRGGAIVLRKSADARDNAMTGTAEDGTVTVTGTYATPAVGTVGISEIMWARDLGKPTVAEQAAGQWIELQNLNDKPVKVLIYAQRGSDGLVSGGLLVNTAAGDNLLGNPGGMVIDAIQNIRNDGNQGNAGWNVKGNDGNSVTGESFASMHRILPHGKPDYRNADGSRYNNRKGTNAGHWAASSSAYLSATAASVSPPKLYEYRGSPGDVNARTGISILTPASRTGIQTADGVYINEVGNRSNDSYDWIELKGPAGKNLRNYMISIVTNNNSDQPLIQFPANDNAKIADSGVFLILASDPVDDPDHPIAPGRNVNRAEVDHERYHWNSPVRYIKSSFSLPNDGEFVLILRKPDGPQGQRSGGHGGQGVAETGNADLDKVVDIAGWDNDFSKGTYPNDVSSTGVWPLYAMRDIKPFTNNSFKVETVHERNRDRVSTNDGASGAGAQDNRNDRTAFGDIGWTGVGYRRGITGGNQHGGTPGYDNGGLQNRGGGIVASVYISEIMYSDGENGTLPQWIELRNTSKTAGADLHNWRLTITNHDTIDAEGTLWTGKATASILLNGLKIKPNSAVLITSRSVTTRSAETYLPNSDIFSLYPTHRGTFGMTSPNDDVINVYGFKITLHTRGNEATQHRELVDEVTNLDTEASDRRGSRERFDPPRWAWPDGMTEDGDRVSVARVNNVVDIADNGFTRSLSSGKEAAGWILSSMDSRTTNIDLVFYGDKDDISTPGQTVRSPLPVSLSSFRPALENGEIVIRWTTESELDNAGFNIYRSDTRDGEYKQVNAEMIQGHGTTGERHTYKWIDTSAKPDTVYYYQIEDVSFAGERQTLMTTKLKGFVSAKNKLTTRWGELKEIQQG